jgi:ABC-type lipoprotein export system ATPase subunit
MYNNLIPQNVVVGLDQITAMISRMFVACTLESNDTVYANRKHGPEYSSDVLKSFYKFYESLREQGSILEQPWIFPDVDGGVGNIMKNKVLLPAKLDRATISTTIRGTIYDMYLESNIDTPDISGCVIRISGNNGTGKSTLATLMVGLKSWMYELDDPHPEERKAVFDALSLDTDNAVYFDQGGNSSLNCIDAYKYYARKDVREMGFKNIQHLSPGQYAKYTCKNILNMTKPGTILIFDEPSAPMDKDGKETFWRKLDEVRKDHVTYIVSHEIPEWFKCDYEIGVSVKLKQD